MELAKQMGAGALCIEGNPTYYGRFGFAAASARGIRCQGTPAEDPAPYFLCKELVEGYLEGLCRGVPYAERVLCRGGMRWSVSTKLFPRRRRKPCLVSCSDGQGKRGAIRPTLTAHPGSAMMTLPAG